MYYSKNKARVCASRIRRRISLQAKMMAGSNETNRMTHTALIRTHTQRHIFSCGPHVFNRVYISLRKQMIYAMWHVCLRVRTLEQCRTS